MPQVTEIDTFQELERQRLVWQALQSADRNAPFSPSIDWLKLFCQRQEVDQQIRILIAHSRGEPLGLLALVRRKRKMLLGTVQELVSPLADLTHGSAIVGPHPAAALACVMRHLSANRDWDLLELGWVTDHTDGGRTALAMRLAGMKRVERQTKQAAVIPLTGGSHSLPRQQYIWVQDRARTTTSIDARCLRYQRHRPLGVMFGDTDPRWDLFQEYVALDRRARHARGLGEASPAERQFQRDLHRLAARDGVLDLHLLRLHGQPLAAAYAFHRHGRVQLQQLHAAPDAGAIDAEAVLLSRILRDSLAREDQQLELAPSIRYTGRWSPRTVTYVRHRCCAPSSLRARLSGRPAAVPLI